MMEFSVDVDWPTKMGYDSDHPMAEGKVGKAGVAIDSIEDMRILFKGIKLEDVSISMSINATSYILLAFYAVVAKQQGADLKKLNGAILTESAGREAYIYPFEPSMRIINHMSEWCSTELPKWNVTSLSGSLIRESGSMAADELVFPTDDSIQQIYAEKLESLKRRRNPARVDSILQDLNDKASEGENIMPVVIEAAENSCTLGEIADTLREIFGEYRP